MKDKGWILIFVLLLGFFVGSQLLVYSFGHRNGYRKGLHDGALFASVNLTPAFSSAVEREKLFETSDLLRLLSQQSPEEKKVENEWRIK